MTPTQLMERTIDTPPKALTADLYIGAYNQSKLGAVALSENTVEMADNTDMTAALSYTSEQLAGWQAAALALKKELESDTQKLNCWVTLY